MPGFYATDFVAVGTASVADVGQTYPAAPIEYTGYVAGSIVSTTTPDTDNFIQGTAALTGLSGKTANTGNSIAYNRNATLNINAGNVLNIWAMYALPSALSNFAATTGGVMVAVGTTATNFSTYRVDGADTLPGGGWRNYMVDLRNTPTGPNTTGSTGITNPTNQYYGATFYQIAAFKTAVPLAVDGIRYGRSTLSATQGTSTTINNVTPLNSTAANFPQMAYYSDYNTGGTPQLSATNIGTAIDGGYHRFGTFSAVSGGYLLKGVLSIGTDATPVYFNDTNRNVFIDDAFLTYNDFNRIEIRNAASTVIVNTVAFAFVPRNTAILAGDAPATPKGNFQMHANALVKFDACSFTDMGTFTLSAGAASSYMNGQTFRRCLTVLPKAMSMYQNTFTNTQSTTGAVQLDSSADGANLSYCNFTNNTVGPAIKITAAGTYNFVGHQFSDNTIQVEFSGSGTCDIVPSGNSNVSQASVAATGGGTINVNTPAVNLSLTDLKSDSEIRAYVGTDPLTATEIGGTESSGTSFTFSQSVGGQAGYIQIFHLEYNPIFQELTYSTLEQSIPIQQNKDRQYARGTTFAPSTT